MERRMMEEEEEERRERDSRRSRGEDRDVCTPVLDREAMWKPSEYRYGGKSPTERTHDSVMPRRPRGEVDEWAALQRLQDEAAVRGEQGWKEQRKQEQKEYMEYIQQQMEERRRSEEREKREKKRELEDAQRSQEVLREEEQRSKQKQKEEASRVKEMYDRQLRDRNHAVRVEREQRRRSEVEYLAMIQEEEKGRKRADAERREYHKREMVMMKDSVDKQVIHAFPSLLPLWGVLFSNHLFPSPSLLSQAVNIFLLFIPATTSSLYLLFSYSFCGLLCLLTDPLSFSFSSSPFSRFLRCLLLVLRQFHADGGKKKVEDDGTAGGQTIC